MHLHVGFQQPFDGEMDLLHPKNVIVDVPVIANCPPVEKSKTFCPYASFAMAVNSRPGLRCCDGVQSSLSVRMTVGEIHKAQGLREPVSIPPSTTS